MDPLAATADTWRGRAGSVWARLLDDALRPPAGGRVRLLDRPGGRTATLWPYTQVLHAAVLVDRLGLDDRSAAALGQGLDPYRRGAAYASVRRPGLGPRFYDDNAWVGLAAAQAVAFGGTVEQPGTSGLARRALRWVRSGESGLGGVRWQERRASRNACSTGSAAVLALRVAEQGPSGPSARADDEVDVLGFAQRCLVFLDGPLRRPDGLVADRIDRRGVVEPTVWAYNQGLAVGLGVLLDRAGVAGALARASDLAGAASRYLETGDRLWRQPPCFVAVWFRMLLLHDQAVGGGQGADGLSAYLDRAWEHVRPDGDVSAWWGSGVGTYGLERTLDTAALVQMAALRALDLADRAWLC